MDGPDIELAFPSVEALNGFFSGKSKKLPKISGLFKKPGLLIAFFKTLLAMSAALGAQEAPKEAEEQRLLVKLFFYLLTSGISQLNKSGHPEVSKWAQDKPGSRLCPGRPRRSGAFGLRTRQGRQYEGRARRLRAFKAILHPCLRFTYVGPGDPPRKGRDDSGHGRGKDTHAGRA